MKVYTQKFLSILCILLLTTSCHLNSYQLQLTSLSSNDSLLIIDINNAQEIEQIRYSEFFSKANAIILDNNEESLIGHINKMQIWNDFIIILDSSISESIFLFNLQGHFIRKIGNIGQGVGEYISVNDFTLDEDNHFILLLDYTSQKVNIYDLNTGNFINSIHLNKNTYTRSYHLYYDKNLYTDAYFQNASKSNYLLQKIDFESTKLIEKYLNVDKYNKGWNNLYYIEENAFLPAEDKNKTYFIQQFMDTIIVIQNDRLYPYAAIKSKSFITNEDLFSIDKNRANEFPLKEIIKKDKIWHIQDIIEHGDYLFFKCWKKNFQLYILYNKKEKKTYTAYIEKNDILYKKIIEKIVPQHHITLNQYGVYTYIATDNIPLLIDYANEGVLSLPPAQIEKIKKLPEDSNPIIIYYEYKK